MRLIRTAAVLVLVAPLAGCLTSATLLTVRPDGSGTIEQTTTMAPETVAQVSQLSSGLAGLRGEAAAGQPAELFSENDARAAAGALGEGVTFVSSEKIKTASAEGLKVVYAFTDITKIRLSQRPAPPTGPMPGVRMRGSGPEEIRFRFSRQPGGTSIVTLVFPDVAPEQTTPAQPGGAARTIDPQALSMARLVLKDLRLSIVLQVAGRIVRTSSPHVQGQRVTLLDMDFNALSSDETMLQKLQAVESIEAAKAILKGVKGFTFNFEREVSVEFAER